MDRRWTAKSEQALARAGELARDKSHPGVGTAHLLAALFEADNFVSLYLQRLGSEPGLALGRVNTIIADVPAVSWLPDPQPPPDADLALALDSAAAWAAELDDEYVSSENLLLGLASGDDDIALTLQAAGVGRGGWQGVIRLRRELWQRQVRPRPRTPGFDGATAHVLVEATRTARLAGVAVQPAHVLVRLADDSTVVGALLDGLGLEPSSVRESARVIAGRAPKMANHASVPAVSDALYNAITAARRVATEAGEPCVGPLSLLRGLAQDRGAVGELLRGVDEMLSVLTDRVRETASRLSIALAAQRRAMQQSDLETAARLLHGEIPVLEQEIEAMGPAEAALARLMGDPPVAQSSSDVDTEYEQVLVALDTARTRDISRSLLRWLADRDVVPGDSVDLAAFCADHDGLITGREAGHAAGRLDLMGLITREEQAVRLSAAGLRCLEDRGGNPDVAA